MKRYIWFFLVMLLLASLASADYTQQQKLTPSLGSNDDYFGTYTALDGDYLVVGAPGNPSVGDRPGAAYVFEYNGSSWAEQQILLAGDGANGDAYGLMVTLDNQTIAIGALQHNNNRGAVYVYTLVADTWTLQQKLTPGDTANDDYFGTYLALDGDRLLIGAPGKTLGQGAVYYFTRSGGTWSQQQKLTASDPTFFATFGNSVAIDGNTALIGSSQPVSGNGWAYVFTFNGSSWVQQAKLSASDGADGDLFGFALALDDDRALISAFRDDDDGDSSGSVYYFTRSGSSWTQQQKLTASDAAAGDEFGLSVRMESGLALISAPMDDNTSTDEGSVYVFELVGSSWLETEHFYSTEPNGDTEFGASLAPNASYTSLAIGSPGRLGDTGAAYIWHDPDPFNATATTTATDLPSATPTATQAFTETPESPTDTPTFAITEATSTFTLTPESPTETPTFALTEATSTPTEVTVLNLLVNSSFEDDTDSNKIPDGWTQKSPTSDKQKCNKDKDGDGIPDKIVAFDGNCAYQFKSAPGENSKLQQVVDSSAVNLGDTLTLGGMVNAKGEVSTKVKVRVKYTDELLEKGKVTFSLTAATADYQSFSGELAVILAGEPANIKVQLQNKGTSGKVFYDALSLTLTEGGSGLRSSLIPSPKRQ